MNAAKPHVDSRQALIEASRPIFADKGLEGATVKDIADAANVNVALISYHFGGKEGLYRAAIESVGRERLELAERMLKPTASAEEFRFRLKVFAEEFLNEHLRHPECMKIIHREFDGENNIALEVFRTVFSEMFSKVRLFLMAGVENKILREDLDADCVGNMIFGSLVNAIRMDFLRKQVIGASLYDPEYAARFIDQLIKGICDGAFRRSST